MKTITAMNETSKKDLQGYVKKTLYSSASILCLILIALLVAYYLSADILIKPLLGGLAGAFLASMNLFAIGYAFYRLAIISGRPRALLVPIGSFLLMCVVAYLFAMAEQNYILGFAFGLTAPIAVGFVVIF